MNEAIRRAVVCLLIVSAVAVVTRAQSAEATIEERLVAFSQQLRIGLTLATVAAYSPTLGDLRLHAQQLVNLLEGPQGKHFARPGPPGDEPIGLLVEITALGLRFEVASIDPGARNRVTDAAKNVRTYLSYALEAALAGLEERRVDRAAAAMLRAYAFLLAAYENPCGTAYVPGLWTILRAFELTDRVTRAGNPG
jgi:hypothetical protein